MWSAVKELFVDIFKILELVRRLGLGLWAQLLTLNFVCNVIFIVYWWRLTWTHLEVFADYSKNNFEIGVIKSAQLALINFIFGFHVRKY